MEDFFMFIGIVTVAALAIIGLTAVILTATTP